MARTLPRFLGETQLRKHAGHPVWLVRRYLDDPCKIPYLLIWQRESDGQVMEAVRLARQKPFDSVELNQADPLEYVELKRTNGSITILQVVWRTLPRNGGSALLLRCPYCETPRRHVYGWEWDSWSGWSNRVRSIYFIGDAALALDCATLPRAVICTLAFCFVLSETYLGLSLGFLTCLRRPKRQGNSGFVNCQPSVGTESGERLTQPLHHPAKIGPFCRLACPVGTQHPVWQKVRHNFQRLVLTSDPCDGAPTAS